MTALDVSACRTLLCRLLAAAIGIVTPSAHARDPLTATPLLPPPVMTKLAASMPPATRLHVIGGKPTAQRIDTAAGELTPVGLFAAAPMVLVARGDLTTKEGAEAIADIKARAVTLRIADDGAASASQRCAKSLQAQLGVTFTDAPATASAADRVATNAADLACIDATTALPLLKTGAIIGLAVAGEDRLASVWDIPSAAEIGLPLFTQSQWYGLYVERTASGEVQAAANKALQGYLADDANTQALTEAGLTAFPLTHRSAEAHGAFLASQE